MSTRKQYKAFISYSHADVRVARWLHRELESYRIPKRLRNRAGKNDTGSARLGAIFMDRDELASSPDLSESIRTALENSENLIIICSPQAARSRWVDQEIKEFKKLGGSERIFCLIAAGTPDPEDPESDCFAPSLRRVYSRDGIPLPGIAEPMAADLDRQADGKKLARQKIIAGLLGVGLDDLRQRELQRRNRRLAMFATASLLLSAVTITLAINATLARREAQIARLEAEQRRIQAEELLGFMVGDLHGNLEPIGRLDILESVGQQAMKYFKTVDVASLSERELLRQAQVMTQLGEIRFSQLQYDEALESFSEAYTRSAELYRENPAEAERLFNLSQAEFWVGYVAWESGDLSEARNWMQRYRDSARKLVELEPGRPEYKMEMIFGIHNLAAIESQTRNYLAAKQAFLQEVALYDELIANDSDLELLLSLADAYSWLGDISFELGDLTEARHYHGICSARYRDTLKRNENATIAEDYLASSLLKQARVEAHLGNLELEGDLIREANQIYTALATQDESNIEWQLAKMRSQVALGYLHVRTGSHTQAAKWNPSAIAQHKALLENGKSDHKVMASLAEAYQLQAWILRFNGHMEQALQAAQSGVDQLRTIQNLTELNNPRLGLLASLLVLQAEMYSDVGDQMAAGSTLGDARQLLSARVLDTNSPSLLEPWARLQMLDGNTKEAEAVQTTLEELHYQPLRPWIHL